MDGLIISWELKDGLRDAGVKTGSLQVDSKNVVGPSVIFLHKDSCISFLPIYYENRKLKKAARIFQGWDDSEARLARYRSSSLNDEFILSLRNLHGIQVGPPF
jgi:hypothetical protein